MTHIPVTRRLQAAYKKLTKQSGVPIPTYLKELREVQTIFSSAFKLMQTILDFGTPHFFGLNVFHNPYFLFISSRLQLQVRRNYYCTLLKTTYKEAFFPLEKNGFLVLINKVKTTFLSKFFWGKRVYK